MSKCANCEVHEGTVKWVGTGGYLALSHGFYQLWCELCCARAQLKYAEDQAMEIHKLRKKVKDLEDEQRITA